MCGLFRGRRQAKAGSGRSRPAEEQFQRGRERTQNYSTNPATGSWPSAIRVKGDSFVPEKPRVWLSKLGGATDWDLDPDGKHLAVVMRVDTPEGAKPDHEVTFIFNFLDELRRKVPVGK